MTLDFYALNEQPFTASADPRFFYMSATHQQAFASLLRSLQANRGFVTLLAQPGLGKTTLLLHALQSFGDRVSTVYLAQPAQTPVDMLSAMLAELGVPEAKEDLQNLLSQLEALLTAEHRLGKRVIVVIDQAHDLDASVFDLLCKLSALQTPRGSLVHFILCGLPLLTERLASIKPTHRVPRITALSHLEPLTAADTTQYMQHRLRIAGYRRRSPLFTAEAAALVARFSGGNPRTINRLCFEVLATASRGGREQIGADLVREAANQLDLAPPTPPTPLPVQLHEAAGAITPRTLPAQVLAQPPINERKNVLKESLPEPVAAPERVACETVVPLPVVAPVPPGAPPTAVASSQPARRPVIFTTGGVVVQPLTSSAAPKADVNSNDPEKNTAPAARPLPLPATAAPVAAPIPAQIADTIAAIQRISAPVKPLSPRLSRPAPRNSAIASRLSILHSLPGLASAAVLLLCLGGAAIVTYRAQRPALPDRGTATALPQPHAAPALVPAQAPHKVTAALPKPAASATQAAAHAIPDRLSAEHDLKGMDLQSALRALSLRSQRRQQSQTRDGRPGD